MAHFAGSKYEETRDLNMAQIAKLVRADIKEAIKAGTLPKGLKTSVRKSEYSMGQSLDITVKSAPFPVLNPDRVLWESGNPHDSVASLPQDHGATQRYTDYAHAVLETLTDLANQYNYDRSDSMTDYFDCAFALHVGYGHELTKAERAEILEASMVVVEPKPEPSPAPTTDNVVKLPTCGTSTYTLDGLHAMARELAGGTYSDAHLEVSNDHVRFVVQYRTAVTKVVDGRDVHEEVVKTVTCRL